jgi:hypothetical protein
MHGNPGASSSKRIGGTINGASVALDGGSEPGSDGARTVLSAASSDGSASSVTKRALGLFVDCCVLESPRFADSVGLRACIPDIGLWTLDSGRWTAGSSRRTLDAGRRTRGFRLRTLGLGLRTVDFLLLTLDLGPKTLDLGRGPLAFARTLFRERDLFDFVRKIPSLAGPGVSFCWREA